MSAGRIEKAYELASTSRVHGSLRRAVLHQLALHANTEGESWPAVATLAAPFGADRREVQRALRALEEAGEIEVVEPGKGSTTRYLLTRYPRNDQGGGADPAPTEGAGKTPQGGAEPAGGGAVVGTVLGVGPTPPEVKGREKDRARTRARPSPEGAASRSRNGREQTGRQFATGPAACRHCDACITTAQANSQFDLCDRCYPAEEARLTGEAAA